MSIPNIICKRFLLFLFLLYSFAAYAQNNFIDSLKQALQTQKDDTNKVDIYADLAWRYQWDYPDTAISYATKGLSLARELNFRRGEIQLLNRMGEALAQKGNYPKALEAQLKALQLSEKLGDSLLIGYSESFTANVYFYSGNYGKALSYFRKQLKHNDGYRFPIWLVFGHLGETYYKLKMEDSANLYLSKSLQLNINWVVPYFYLAALNFDRKNYTAALRYYQSGVGVADRNVDKSEGYIGLAKTFRELHQPDSAIRYAKQSISSSKNATLYSKLEEAAEILADIYKTEGNLDSAYQY